MLSSAVGNKSGRCYDDLTEIEDLFDPNNLINYFLRLFSDMCLILSPKFRDLMI